MSDGYARLRQQRGTDRGTRIFVVVLGHLASAGLAVYSLFLAFGAVLAISFCSSEADDFGCAPSMKYHVVAIPPVGNLVGLVLASAFTWLLKPTPRLRWLGVGLVVQVAAIVMAYVALPLVGFRLI